MTMNKINVQVDYDGSKCQIGIDSKYESQKRTEERLADKEQSERDAAITDFVTYGTKLGEFMGKKSVGIFMIVFESTPMSDGTNHTDELAVDVAINISVNDEQTMQDIINIAVNELNKYNQKMQEIEKQKEDEKKD